MEVLESFFETKDDSLWSYIENTSYQMGNKNDEYKNIINNIENLLDSYPNLRKVLEDEKPIELSEEESKALIKLYNLYLNKRDIDLRNAFFLGSNNLYYYLKQMRLLDD